METNKRRMGERLMGDVLCADSVVLRGDRCVTAYGCRRILHYGADRICLHLGKRKLSVTGEGLICRSFSAGTVAMEGRVSGVRYCADVCEKCPFCAQMEEDT